jgi:hypothetical protein
MRFLTSGFFHQTILSGPLIHGLKHFWIWLRIRKVIQQSQCLSCVNDTAQAAWAVSMTPLRLPEQCQWTRSGHLSGFNYANLVQNHVACGVSLTLLRLPERWHWHHFGCLSGINNDTAQAAWAVSMTPLRRYDTAPARDLEFERLWSLLKGISM